MKRAETSLVDWAAAILGHRFEEAGLLRTALTHSSVHRAGRGGERLEFLGDRVLGLAVAAMLYRAFPTEAEGPLSRRLAELVRRETLASVGGALGLDERLMVSTDSAGGRARAERTVRADTLEAVLGAVFLDGGWAAATALVDRLWGPLIDARSGPPQDAKTRLQEWVQGQGLGLPGYTMRRLSGPDHAPLFQVEVAVAGHDPAVGEGPSRRAAEQDAAARLLVALGGA